MENIINVKTLIGESIIKTRLSQNDDIIFIKDNIFNDISQFPQKLKYTGIKKLNTKDLKVEDYTFKSFADIISIDSSAFTIYYARIVAKEETNSIYINKLNCENLIDEEILEISFGTKNEFLSDSYIIGLNDRYAILFVPHSTLVYGRPFFEKCILIDSIEKKTYDIPDKIIEDDTLLRLDEAWLSRDGQYILLKTGRIRPGEKKNIWNEYAKSCAFSEYHDHIESIILCEINEFVKSTKSSNNISFTSIIDNCDMNKSLSIITVADSLTYSINDFERMITEVKTFNFATKKILSIESKRMYDSILYFNNEFYGIVLTNSKEQEIYSFENNALLYCTDEDTIFVNNDYIITCKPKHQTFNRIFSLKDLQSKKVVQTFEGRFLEFDFNNNHLVLY